MSGDWTKAIQGWGAAVLLVLSALPAAAQTTSGGVSGTVHDDQGAVIPGATATLTSNTRGTVLNAGVNRTGDFVFPTVQPDTYTLNVKADGFNTTYREIPGRHYWFLWRDFLAHYAQVAFQPKPQS